MVVDFHMVAQVLTIRKLPAANMAFVHSLKQN